MNQKDTIAQLQGDIDRLTARVGDTEQLETTVRELQDELARTGQILRAAIAKLGGSFEYTLTMQAAAPLTQLHTRDDPETGSYVLTVSEAIL